MSVSGLTREFRESDRFYLLRLKPADLAGLVSLMTAAFAGAPHTMNLSTAHGRSSTTYGSLSDLEVDDALPDVVRDMRVSVRSPYGAVHELTITFSTAVYPSVTVTGTDEAVVIGTKQRLVEFLRRYEARYAAVARFYDPAWKFLLFATIPLIAISQLITLSVHGLLAPAFQLMFLFLFLAIVSIVLAKPFGLIVRERSKGALRELFTSSNILIVLTVVIIVLSLVAWLFPRTPV
ncbi:MAG: hypothetical protein QOF71_10 [Candidatus Eremiobacteraeota bacterium]|jgi:hypothetical protein|nr:hypothetical protein [Candidatus Eremiobacteraeota bacterium]